MVVELQPPSFESATIPDAASMEQMKTLNCDQQAAMQKVKNESCGDCLGGMRFYTMPCCIITTHGADCVPTHVRICAWCCEITIKASQGHIPAWMLRLSLFDMLPLFLVTFGGSDLTTHVTG